MEAQRSAWSPLGGLPRRNILAIPSTTHRESETTSKGQADTVAATTACSSALWTVWVPDAWPDALRGCPAPKCTAHEARANPTRPGRRRRRRSRR